MESDNKQREGGTVVPPSLSQGLVLIMAVACALSVANLYYNQPLLALMATTFQVPEAQVGIIPTLSQVGYAAGLGLLVPLGDIRERRRLIVLMLLLVSAALVAAALAPSLWFLAAASLAVGVTTVVPQMLLPFAVHLAHPAMRGKIVGMIMSGLLLGILLSRTVAGFIGASLGWRAVFWGAAALMIFLAVLLQMVLPESHPDPQNKLTYGDLLRSVARLAREQPVLREAALGGALLFAGFSVFWATLVFHLASPTFHLDARAAGMFGLVGAIGALAAPISGRLADRRDPRFMVGVGTITTFASFLVFGALGSTLWGLVLGVILLDLGVQAAQISNQTRVYSLVPNASSRLNTVYMVSYFLGGAAGSLLGALGWSLGGWQGVCLVGLGLTGTALLLHGRAVARARQAPQTI